jgi:hypothetical protein
MYNYDNVAHILHITKKKFSGLQEGMLRFTTCWDNQGSILKSEICSQNSGKNLNSLLWHQLSQKYIYSYICLIVNENFIQENFIRLF